MSETETGKAPIISPMFAIIRLTVFRLGTCDANHIINHDTNHTESLKTMIAAKATAIAAIAAP